MPKFTVRMKLDDGSYGDIPIYSKDIQDALEKMRFLEKCCPQGVVWIPRRGHTLNAIIGDILDEHGVSLGSSVDDVMEELGVSDDERS